MNARAPTQAELMPLTTALDALQALILAVLKSDRPGRFQEASTLCSLGQSMKRLLSDRAEDFDDYDQNQGCNPVMPYPGRQYARAQGRVVAAGVLGGHDNQAERDLALGAVPMMQAGAEGMRAQWAAAEAGELEKLLVMVKTTDDDKLVAIMKRRIETLTTAMEKRNNAYADLVSADIPRGHPAGVDSGGPNGALLPRADTDGDGGHARVAQEGDRAAAVPAEVGDPF